MTKIKTMLLTALLIAVLIITSFLALTTAKKSTRTSKPSINTPDFFMINAEYKKFNQKGEIRNQFKTTKITHFNSDNTYLFDNPKMVMNTPNEQPWNISASKGKSKKGKKEIHLWDNIKIIRKRGNNNSDYDISTTELTIYTDSKIAETDKPIKIVQSQNITKSIGAKADFKSGNIKLLSNIEGTYKIK